MAVRKGRGTPRTMLVVLVLLTAGHAAYRWLLDDSSGIDAVIVSDLEAGAVVPEFQVEIATLSGWTAGPLLEKGACQLLVAFDPACPYCLRAAEGEASLSPERRLPTTWVTNAAADGAMAYRKHVGEGVRIARSDDVIEALEVKGVPAAFLVDARGAIRRVWPYKGVETRAELEPRCRVAEADDAPAISAVFPTPGRRPAGAQ